MVDSVLGVFTDVGSWLVDNITTMSDLFYTTGSNGIELTYIGTLAVVGLGISVGFLLINTVKDFLRFR